MAKVQVVASATGFDNVCMRYKGDVFDVPESVARKYASWFKPVDPKFKVEPKVERAPAGEVGTELTALKAQVAQLASLLAERQPEGKGKGRAKQADPDPDNTELV